jgi:hypothetical protein
VINLQHILVQINHIRPLANHPVAREIQSERVLDRFCGAGDGVQDSDDEVVVVVAAGLIAVVDEVGAAAEVVVELRREFVH